MYNGGLNPDLKPIVLTQVVNIKRQLTLFSVITPTTAGLRNPIIVPAVFAIPITIPDTPGAISRTFTSYPECNRPENATPIHIAAIAI